jgi:hypothetical protein
MAKLKIAPQPGEHWRVFLMVCLLGAAFPAAPARIYKWVDADGNVQYTQTPPPGGIKSEEIKPPPPPVDTGAAVKALEEQRAVLDKSRDDRIKAAEQEQRAQQESADRQRQCEQAKLRLAAYERPRVNVVGEGGSRRRATEEERVAEIAKAREAVQQLCN